MAGEGQGGGPHGGWSTPWQVRDEIRSSLRVRSTIIGSKGPRGGLF
jgi:hypothetical protein